MIYSQNNQQVASSTYQSEPGPTYKFNDGIYAYKLDVSVKFEEDEKEEPLFGPVIIQTTEDPQHVFDNSYFTEQLLELGFWSKPFVTPITGFRFRLPDGIILPGLVDVVAYG